MVEIHNILNSRVKPSEQYRETPDGGWRLPMTTAHELSFAQKAARVARADDLRATIAALVAIGTEGTSIDDDGLREVVERTGTTMKHVRWQRVALNTWLMGLERYVARFGEIDASGRLVRGHMAWTGGLTTTMLLAGDDFGLSPWVLVHGLLANARMIVKPSSMEPLSTFLFARAAVEKGLSVPAIVYLDTTSEADVTSIIDLVARADQSVVFGEDRTIETVYRRAAVMPPHKAIPYWSGRSGAIVLDGANVEQAAQLIVTGATSDRGNKCICTKKVYVPRAMAGALEQALIAAADRLRRGDPLDPQTDIGRLDDGARTLAERAVGAGVVLYDRDLLIVRTDDDQSPLVCEEVPYPALAVRPYDEHEDPVALANATVARTPSGRALCMSVFAPNGVDFQRAARRLLAFKIFQNAPTSIMDALRSHQGMHMFLELMRPIEYV